MVHEGDYIMKTQDLNSIIADARDLVKDTGYMTCSVIIWVTLKGGMPAYDFSYADEFEEYDRHLRLGYMKVGRMQYGQLWR